MKEPVNEYQKAFRQKGWYCSWFLDFVTKKLERDKKNKKYWTGQVQFAMNWKKELSDKEIILPKVNSDNE